MMAKLGGRTWRLERRTVYSRKFHPAETCRAPASRFQIVILNGEKMRAIHHRICLQSTWRVQTPQAGRTPSQE